MRVRAAAAALETESVAAHWAGHVSSIEAALTELKAHIGA
jgi:hypothetical protein